MHWDPYHALLKNHKPEDNRIMLMECYCGGSNLCVQISYIMQSTNTKELSEMS